MARMTQFLLHSFLPALVPLADGEGGERGGGLGGGEGMTLEEGTESAREEGERADGGRRGREGGNRR